MLEILILWHFCKKVGLYARQHGRKAIGYQVLLVAMWFGMEFIGLAAGYTLSQGDAGMAYLFGVAGAVGGLIAAIVIAKTRSNLGEPQGFAVTPVAPLPVAQDQAARIQ